MGRLPKSITRDSQGTLIEVGCLVAYNRSGDVVLGRVEHLTYGKRPPIKIRQIKANHFGNYPVSEVKNPRSVLVLTREQLEELL